MAHLQLEHLDFRMLGDASQTIQIQLAIHIPHAIFGSADLEYDVTTPIQMVRRQTALAGIEPTVGELGTV